MVASLCHGDKAHYLRRVPPCQAPSATVPALMESHLMAEKDTCPLWGHCHQCLPGSLHMSSGEEGGSQGGFMEEVMFESGIDIYQEDRCPWNKGNGMSPAEC